MEAPNPVCTYVMTYVHAQKKVFLKMIVLSLKLRLMVSKERRGEKGGGLVRWLMSSEKLMPLVREGES